MNKLTSLDARLLAGFCSGCCRLGDFNLQGIAKQRFKHPQKLCSSPRCALRKLKTKKMKTRIEKIFSKFEKARKRGAFSVRFQFHLKKLSEKHFLA